MGFLLPKPQEKVTRPSFGRHDDATLNQSAARVQTKTDGGTTTPPPTPTPSLCTPTSPSLGAGGRRRALKDVNAATSRGVHRYPELRGHHKQRGDRPTTAALAETLRTPTEFEGFPGSGSGEFLSVPHRGIPCPFLQLSAPAPDAHLQADGRWQRNLDGLAYARWALWGVGGSQSQSRSSGWLSGRVERRHMSL
ncbi:hypothetical protein B0H14DRAFT_3469884 [Mycena olivaceomarginata]|nr:hypothetical protein B0H14DRAFT_3469884 [Mycena olivaceomarginata]